MKLTGCDKHLSRLQEGHYLLLNDIIHIKLLIYLHTYLTLVSPILCFMVAKRVASINVYVVTKSNIKHILYAPTLGLRGEIGWV